MRARKSWAVVLPATVLWLAGCSASSNSGTSTKADVATQGPPVQLSVGIALPQATVNGTAMTFSVDYEFTQGEPSPAGYVWVIKRAHGDPLKKPVQLRREGNLAAVVTGWRPREGPFQAYIVDQSGNRQSATIDLQ
jgi:hypothetical protein